MAKAKKRRRQVRLRRGQRGMQSMGFQPFRMHGHVTRHRRRSGPRAFEVCVQMESGMHYKDDACASGKNPRAALRNALFKFARVVGRRSGAFADCAYGRCG